MPTLYTYVVATDSGAAPNPFGGVCTLVICKPEIRRTAEVGDWVVGTGSAGSPVGDIRGQVVHAMRVSAKLPMAGYDDWARRQLPVKVPGGDSPSPLSRVGDAIYDFSESPPRLRRGSVHCEGDRERDLGGRFALLSEHFYYFGAQPRPLPEPLRPIVKEGQGHRSSLNDEYVEDFIEWIEGLGAEPNRLHGRPAELKDFGGFEEALAQIETAELRPETSGQGVPSASGEEAKPDGSPADESPPTTDSASARDVSREKLDRLKARTALPNTQVAAYLCGMLAREQVDPPSHEALVTSANLVSLKAWDRGLDLSDLDQIRFGVSEGGSERPRLVIQKSGSSAAVPLVGRPFALEEPWGGRYRLSKVVPQPEGAGLESDQGDPAPAGGPPMKTVWQNRKEGASFCEGCPGRDSPYPLGGLGDPNADLMLVAQQPNYNVGHDKARMGMSWEEAKQALQEDRRESMNPLWRQMTNVAHAAGLGGPMDLYFTNLAKCDDRESRWEGRYGHCQGYFLREMQEVSPGAVLLYGRKVIGAVFDLHDLDEPETVGDVHAKPQPAYGRILVPLYHWGHSRFWTDSYQEEVAKAVREACRE
ncbi:MAG: hypothetical protein ABEL97_07345 [Salinibacter sp.]